MIFVKPEQNNLEGIMKRSFVVLFVLLACFSLNAQKTEERPVSSFDKLDVFGNIVVDLIKGNQEKVVVESQEIALDRITTKMDGKSLKISMAADLCSSEKTVRILITYVQLYEIRSKGGADIRSDVPITADRLVYEAVTGGNIYVDVNVKALEASVGQGSLISISGKASSEEINVNSGGIFSGYDMECDEVNVNATTKAKAKVYAGKTLNARATTGGWIGYQGHPAQKIVKTSLGGKIEETVPEEQ